MLVLCCFCAPVGGLSFKSVVDKIVRIFHGFRVLHGHNVTYGGTFATRATCIQGFKALVRRFENISVETIRYTHAMCDSVSGI